jgi:anti-sigma regulatory factor (Ser/Thr protein kinase)
MSEMASATPPFHHPRRQRPRTGTWARRTHLELGALRGAVPCARLHTRQVLWEWGLSGLNEAAELVVSELITNAVQASVEAARRDLDDGEPAGVPGVWLWLTSDGREVVVEVGDGSPRPPVPAAPDRDEEGGRGLLLVETLSQAWGYYFPADEPDADGPEKAARKIVWALFTRS